MLPSYQRSLLEAMTASVSQPEWIHLDPLLRPFVAQKARPKTKRRDPVTRASPCMQIVGLVAIPTTTTTTSTAAVPAATATATTTSRTLFARAGDVDCKIAAVK